jgi:hypothetical protein
MKPIAALPLLAALGVLAGCGIGMKSGRPPVTFTITGTTTMTHLKSGAVVRCKGGSSTQVPPRGESVAAGQDELVTGTTKTSSSLGEILLTHRRDGSVKASCRK